MTAYYNEIDPYAAAWLRNLIAAGEIAPGDVDERSIKDVKPDELLGYTQCHFFAGIAVWSYALRRAGWPDDRPVWTGSCPCQPFSAAGRSEGTADERHLWPHWHYLIEQCRPPVIFGEQVEAAIRHGWLDLVQTDLEGSGYACGAIAAPAAGFGAPHIRARLYFAAHTLAVTDDAERRTDIAGRDERDGAQPGRAQGAGDIEGRCGAGELAKPAHIGHEWTGPAWGWRYGRDESHRPGPVNGFWGAADWLHCTDGKWRPVEPGLEPLVNGAAARVGRLRAYGNAICAPQAQAFIEAYMSAAS